VSFTLFSLKFGKHVTSHLQNVLANFLNFISSMHEHVQNVFSFFNMGYILKFT